MGVVPRGEMLRRLGDGQQLLAEMPIELKLLVLTLLLAVFELYCCH